MSRFSFETEAKIQGRGHSAQELKQAYSTILSLMESFDITFTDLKLYHRKVIMNG